jgi:hypothetical protein
MLLGTIVILNSHFAPFSRTGKMPVPQKFNVLVEQAGFLFINGLLRMVQDLILNQLMKKENSYVCSDANTAIYSKIISPDD